MSIGRKCSSRSSNILAIHSVHFPCFKALDLVLFGFQESSSLTKDIALAGLLGLLIGVLVMFKKHKNRSKQQMEELSTVLNKLRDMETDFEGVQNRLNFHR